MALTSDRQVRLGVSAADMRAALDLIEAWRNQIPPVGALVALVFIVAEAVTALGAPKSLTDRWPTHTYRPCLGAVGRVGFS